MPHVSELQISKILFLFLASCVVLNVFAKLFPFQLKIIIYHYVVHDVVKNDYCSLCAITFMHTLSTSISCQIHVKNNGVQCITLVIVYLLLFV